MNNIDELLATRTAQLLDITEDQRDSGDESNPILFAESGPCRYRVMTLWFTDDDGITITEDDDPLEDSDISVKYFSSDGEIELTSGELYEWAIDFMGENY